MIPPNREANEATLSALQHFAFCRRQWGLIFLERQWAENARTAEGHVFHETAHHGPESEARGDLLILRGLRVASPTLRLGGVCDVVEFHRSPSGVSLAGREGLWLPYPVEYKKGSDQTKESDEVQLCGQRSVWKRCCAVKFQKEAFSMARPAAEPEWLLTGRSGSERLICFTSCWGTWIAATRPAQSFTRAATPVPCGIFACRN